MLRTLTLSCLLVTLLGAGWATRALAGPGGTLELSLGGAPQCLDPIRADDDTSRLLVANLYDRLFAYHYLNRPYELVPALAAAMPDVSEDGLTWTIRLRDDLVFADDPCFKDGKGRAVTATDVVFCFLRLMDASAKSSSAWVFKNRIEGLDAFAAAAANAPPDPHRSSYDGKHGFPAVSGLEAVDAHTLRIRLTMAFPELPWLLAATQTSIYPPEAVQEYGEKLARHVVGTGPYVVRSHIPDRSMVLAANPHYRGPLYPSQGRRDDARAGMLDDAARKLPLNDMVVLTFAETGTIAWNRFLKGESDLCAMPHEVMTSSLDPATLEPLEHLGALAIQVHRHPRLEIFYDAFAMQDPVVGAPAGDKGRALRRAICLATSTEWEMQALYRNAVERVDGPLLPEFPESDPTFQAAWVRQTNETLEEAQAAAREILAEVGYTADAPPPLLTKDILEDEGSRQTFALFQKELAAIGIRVESHVVPWADLRKRIADGKAQMWSSYWLADYPSAQNFLQLFAGSETPDPLSGGYDNAEYKVMYEAARRLGPGEERTTLYRDMQERVTQDCPWRFRFRRLRFDATRDWLHNYRYNEIAPRFFEFCRVDSAKRAAFRQR